MTRGRELVREKCQASKSLEDKIFHRKSIKLGKHHRKTWLFKFTQIPGNPAIICPYSFNSFQIQELLAQATHTRRAKLSAAQTLSQSPLMTPLTKCVWRDHFSVIVKLGQNDSGNTLPTKTMHTKYTKQTIGK